MHFEQSAILTVHNHVITRNPRISVTHDKHDKHKTWYLHINNVQEEDKGMGHHSMNILIKKLIILFHFHYIYYFHIKIHFAGKYMCQINTIMAKTQFGYLSVVGECNDIFFCMAGLTLFMNCGRLVHFDYLSPRCIMCCLGHKKMWLFIVWNISKLFIQTAHFTSLHLLIRSRDKRAFWAFTVRICIRNGVHGCYFFFFFISGFTVWPIFHAIIY